MCDVMGLGEGEGTGISFCDILAVIKGHAPEGHKVRGGAFVVRSRRLGHQPSEVQVKEISQLFALHFL